MQIRFLSNHMSCCTLVANKFVSTIFGQSGALLITNSTHDDSCCSCVYGVESHSCIGVSSSKITEAQLSDYLNKYMLNKVANKILYFYTPSCLRGII